MRQYSDKAGQWKTFSGFELKSTSKVGLSILLGFFMTWTSASVASSIGWQSRVRHSSPCLEMGQCDTPWWAVAWLGIVLLGPALTCGAFAMVGIHRQWKTKRVLRWFSITWLATLTFACFSGIS
jgi:hypothetical protein